VAPKDIDQRLRKTRIIVCDVDGVLTDGGVTFDADGRPMRTFQARDLAGFTLWRLAGGQSALVSGLGSKAMETLADRWQCAECRMWTKDKRRACEEIAAAHGLGLDEMAFLGDDIIDLRAVEAVGLGVAVADAAPKLLAAADLVTHAAGGEGALRELVERILVAQGRFDQVLAAYCSREDPPQEDD